MTVVDDGTTSDDDRLGAIGDLGFVIDGEGIDDDLVVVAGDNLLPKTSVTSAGPPGRREPRCSRSTTWATSS